jgi:hypothetical protein
MPTTRRDPRKGQYARPEAVAAGQLVLSAFARFEQFRLRTADLVASGAPGDLVGGPRARPSQVQGMLGA